MANFKIMRNGLNTEIVGDPHIGQSSEDVTVAVSDDGTYSGYAKRLYYSYCYHNELRRALSAVNSNGEFVIPVQAFFEPGMVKLSVELSNGTNCPACNACFLIVTDGAKDVDTSVLPSEKTWQSYIQSYIKSDVYALERRIDNLILSSGTESSAEVIDARMGFDGTSYDTLGTAIRAQVNNLNNDLNKLNDGGLVLKDEIIEEGINNWLDEHPEATTTVQDGTIDEQKINKNFLPWIKKDYVTPQMFGAKGDGITDDSDAFQSAINYAVTNNVALYLHGTYDINATISVSGTELYIFGTGAKIRLNVYGLSGSCESVYIENVTFEGLITSSTPLIAINGCVNATFNRVTIKNVGGFAVSITGTDTGTAQIIDCYAENIYRDSFRLTHFYNAYAYNNKFVNIGDDCISFSTDEENGSCEIKGNYIENGYGFNLLGRSNVYVCNNVFRYSRGFIKTGISRTEGRNDCTNVIVKDNIVKLLHPTNARREFQFYYYTSNLLLENNVFEDDDTTNAPSTCTIIGVYYSSPTWNKGFYNSVFENCTKVKLKNNVFGVSTGTNFGSTKKFKFTSCTDFQIVSNDIVRFTTQIVESAYSSISGSVIEGNYIDSDPDGDLGALPSVFIQALANQCLKNTFFNVGQIAYKNEQRVYFTYESGTLGGTGGLSMKNQNIQIDATTKQIVVEPLKFASSMPSEGYYMAGYFVQAVNSGRPLLLGWRRVTTGTNHVLGTDWQELVLSS